MKEIRYFYVPGASSSCELPEEEAKHAIRVLRLQSGDRMVLVDGEGRKFDAEVSVSSGKHCMYNILEEIKCEKEWRGRVTLAIAPTKMMDRIEWLAEKATEIGFDEIDFVDCKFSERKSLRADRIERIVVSAMKQSHKACKPCVADMVPFEKFIQTQRDGYKFIAHCYDEIERMDLFDQLRSVPVDEPVTIMVGPEGDFSIDEVHMAIAHGFVPVSLGRCRLRTETAGLSAVMMASLCKRQKID